MLSDTEMGSTSALANGINWAAGRAAKVINISLVVGASATFETAVNNAWNAGVVLVAAAGNGGSENIFYPAAYPNVIAVGAQPTRTTKPRFQPTEPVGYHVGNGTLMSAPIVAATAALVWSADPTALPKTVRDKVELTSEKKPGQKTDWKYGRVNACKALGKC